MLAKITESPWGKKVGIALLGTIILLFLFSLINRPPHVDDAWLGEYSYWFATTGTTKSELMRGITDHENKLVVHHKLHTYIAAPVIKAFGFSLPAMKATSLVFFLLFIFLFYRFSYKKILSKNEFLLALTLLLFNAMIFEHSFVYRPDIPMMCLGFVSFVFLDGFLKSDKNKLPVLLSGLLAGLATSMHLNGLIFIFAGFMLLVLNKQFKNSILFGIATVPALAIYFLDMTTIADFHLWIYQYSASPHLKNPDQQPLQWDLFYRIANEQMRYLHSPKEISFTLLLVAALVFAFRHLRKYQNLLRYTLLLALALMMISIHKTSYYLIVLMPFFVLIIILSVKYVFDEKPELSKTVGRIPLKTQKEILAFLLLAYLATQLVYIIPVAFNKYDNERNRMISEKYIGHDTDSLSIIAPMKFVYNEIEHYKRIQGEICYNELKKLDSTIYQEGFLAKADEFDIDYIILNKFFMSHFGMDKMTSEQIDQADFELIHRDEDMLILKNRHQAKPNNQ